MKRLVFFIVLIFASQIANAQIHFGPKAGFTSTTFQINQDSIENGFRNNLLVGAFVRLGGKFHIQPEVNWYTQGTIFKPVEINNLSPIEQEITLSGIEIPLQVGYKLLDLKLVNLRVFAGPAANIVLNKEVSTNSGAGFIDPIEEADIKDLHWGFKAGVGVDVLMFSIDAKYSLGLNEVFDTSRAGLQNYDARSRAFEFSIGWKIF